VFTETIEMLELPEGFDMSHPASRDDGSICRNPKIKKHGSRESKKLLGRVFLLLLTVFLLSPFIFLSSFLQSTLCTSTMDTVKQAKCAVPEVIVNVGCEAAVSY
jgi:hypothetical protein